MHLVGLTVLLLLGRCRRPPLCGLVVSAFVLVRPDVLEEHPPQRALLPCRRTPFPDIGIRTAEFQALAKRCVGVLGSHQWYSTVRMEIGVGHDHGFLR